MREPSASHLALAALCAHPWTSGIRWPEDRSTAGDFGTRTHLGAESLVTGEPVYPAVFAGLGESERADLLSHVEQARAFLAAVRTRGVVWERAELRLRYDVEHGTAREVGRWEAREPGQWTAILDYCAEMSDGRLLVVDWKTGRQTLTEKAERNPQVRLQALAAARWAGARRVRVVLVHLEADRYETSSADFGPWELAQIAEEARELRASLRRGPTPPVPGSHCTERYCPLRGVCAATASALAAVQPLERPLLPVIQDDAHALYTLQRIAGAEAALGEIKHALAEWARTRPIDLPDGRRYGWRQHEKRTVKVDTAEQRAALARVLGEHGTTAVQTSYETTIGAIEAAARAAVLARGEDKGFAKLANQALEALREAGGLTVSTYEKPETFRLNGKEKST
jgi:hypothetical protein